MHTLSWDQPWLALPDTFYQRLQPSPLDSPYLVHGNENAARLLGIVPDQFAEEAVLHCLNGDRLLPAMRPLATVYAGHQFGIYTSQLGDGRAILLGRVENARGERYDIQLKGAGLTRYSRTLDGRYPLGEAIREYLCGEALTGLGIASTRGLCLLGSRTEIQRDQRQTATLLVRIAKSTIRFGHFEYFHHGDRFDQLRELFDFVIEQHFPEFLNESAASRPRLFLETVIGRSARLIADWQSAGFVHGVMNTDNMSISGETLDLGPYGFVERYDPDFSPNPTDEQKRYQLDQQVDIGRWNCLALAQALTSLLPSPVIPAGLLRLYRQAYQQRYLQRMRAKLGLVTEHPADADLIVRLLSTMSTEKTDYSLFFRRLADFDDEPDSFDFIKRSGLSRAWRDWLNDYRQRLILEKTPSDQRRERMHRCNPCYVLRPHLLQRAITAAERGDYSELNTLVELMQNPYFQRVGKHSYQLPAPL